MTARDDLYRRSVLVKVQSGFQSIFREIMQDKSNIIFWVMFFIDQDFNNSKK